MTFVSRIFPYNDNPKYDLDMGNYSLVKSYVNGKHGTTYPDMAWEPKESFKAVANYYVYIPKGHVFYVKLKFKTERQKNSNHIDQIGLSRYNHINRFGRYNL
jgi:hypothetical protein